MGFKEWWDKYLDDPQFRLEQEIEAYQNQYQYAKEHYPRNKRKFTLKETAKALSGKMYGNLVTFEEAKDLIQR